jgi:hypothetical protein
MNQMDLIKNFMTKGMTPKGIVKNIAKNNPVFSNLINMVEKGDNKGVETFARNYLKERGMDLDKEMSKMKNKLGIN